MDPVQRYALSLPAPPGSDMPPQPVVVHWTPERAAGLPVYQDTEGSTRAVIGPDHVARLLGADGTVRDHRLHAVQLP
ncbi:DUF6296 family protein [Kitasatospora sp. LaBMicrA B282]|uniref:DUF6296 family protein n=1 Tax=Kitasatospora sp. LaBMicrA B282 TaxID=3420949 RepID=UPI003D0BDDCB